MSPRKRSRRQAFGDEETDTQLILNEDSRALPEKQRVEKEQEVWDAIREAHYEAIEQLPLTLHRQLSLMRQLDEQTTACTAGLLPALQKYIQLRQTMAGISAEQSNTAERQTSKGASAEDEFPPPPSQSHDPTSMNGNFALIIPASKRPRNGISHSPPAVASKSNSTPPENVKPPETTRELLSHVAFMAEELLRASQEKVNLAQANHDSVERHIRLLDQAIKEQEATLSSDQSRSSNGIVIHLPELVVPRWPRNSRSAPAIADISDLLDGGQDSGRAEEAGDSRRGSATKVLRQGTGQDNQAKNSSSLTITLPATQANEELYCYCNRVSFGEMIACDGDPCEREWFHLGCVGLTEIPEGEWYCEDCRIDEL
ncbi:hypothetical protein GALMADRAFT_239266 [Galerina marginata CBS 339.88]|uniref:Chromatin modification-related protein n=1 Tax=Galerina marginata (strain CBS 339.88) TaxID=685588 RepID=A0A067TE20_GALM3|nr:hypothetical protein GALMADRAFT_239266 [Galerina marginata CBS 339.88]